MQTILHKIGEVIVTAGIMLAGLFGFHTTTAPTENVGATIPVTVAVFQTSLQASITSTATSMTLVSGTDKAGNNLAGYICFNIDEGTTLEEFVCGTASGTSVSSMLRGIDPIDGNLEVSALKKAHRRGASVKITNYPTLGILSRIMNGNETIPNAITYANGVTPTNAGDLADKEYVLSVVSGGSVSFEKIVLAGTAGETISAGNLIYLKSSDGRWWKTDADTASTVENVKLGIAQGAGTAGSAITDGVLVSGRDTNQTGLSANTIYYASNTAGGISSSAGTKEVTIGIALTTTEIIFAPRYNQQITEDEQDALAGTSGTPSSSNKFVTDADTSATTSANKIYRMTAEGKLDATLLIGNLPALNGSSLTFSPKNGSTTYDVSTASGIQNIAHGLGKIPSKVRISAGMVGDSSTIFTTTVYNGTTQSSLYTIKSDTGEEIGTTFRLRMSPSAIDYATGVVTMDSTNIIITWTKTENPTGTANIMWEAE